MMSKLTEVYFNHSENENEDLGPDNKESQTLMSAMINLIDPFKNPKYQNNEEDFSCTGIGRDTFGKFAWTDVEHNGVEYEIQLRNKSNLKRKKLELNKLNLTLLPTKDQRNN